MKKKILLTGSSGFIGNSLTINLLKQKHEIYVILKNDKKNKLYLEKPPNMPEDHETSILLKKKSRNMLNMPKNQKKINV